MKAVNNEKTQCYRVLMSMWRELNKRNEELLAEVRINNDKQKALAKVLGGIEEELKAEGLFRL